MWKQFAVPPTITLERRRAAGAATCSDPERIAHFRSWQAVLIAVLEGVACNRNSCHEKKIKMVCNLVCQVVTGGVDCSETRAPRGGSREFAGMHDGVCGLFCPQSRDRSCPSVGLGASIGTKGAESTHVMPRVEDAVQWKRRVSYGTCGNRIGGLDYLVCV